MTPATASSGAARDPLRRVLHAFVDIRELALIAMIALIVILMAGLNPCFPSFSSLRALSVGMAPTAAMVIGMAILRASGGFELSVGSVMALSSTIVAMPVPVASCSGDVPGSKRSTFFGVDGFNPGRIGGEMLAQAIGG